MPFLKPEHKTVFDWFYFKFKPAIHAPPLYINPIVKKIIPFERELPHCWSEINFVGQFLHFAPYGGSLIDFEGGMLHP